MKALRIVLVELVLLAVVVAQWDTAKAVTYNPTMAVSISDTEAGANEDVTTEFTIPVGDFNFDVMIVFTPLEFGMGDPNTSLGAHVADLQSDSTLGLLNNVCITALPVSFEMLKATTNTADTISFEDGFADLDGNTLPDAVDKYPDFLNTMYPGITPLSRSYGQTSVAGTPMSMNQVVFEPGTVLPGLPAFDASLGYGVVSVLNDPTAEPQPGAITDFCTPVANATTVFGITKDNPDTPADESGYVGRTNPTVCGDYTFIAFSRSQGDADGDNIENDLDTCPFTVNEGDPRVAGSGDPDNDGIDNVCDPTPDEANTDHDGDVYLNRGDNCPLVNNPDNADSDGDRIGDACDTEGNGPDTPDGDPIDAWLEVVVTIWSPEDQDCDGFDDYVEAYIGTDPLDDCTNDGSPEKRGTHDAWPFDINIDTWSNILDVLLYKGHLQCQVGDPCYDRRLDFNADAWVNILDVLLYEGHLQVQCTNP
jgi:hypothetical protein